MNRMIQALIAGLVVALFLAAQQQTVPTKPDNSQVGRFQMQQVVVPDSPANPLVFVIDTATGQVWKSTSLSCGRTQREGWFKYQGFGPNDYPALSVACN